MICDVGLSRSADAAAAVTRRERLLSVTSSPLATGKDSRCSRETIRTRKMPGGRETSCNQVGDTKDGNYAPSITPRKRIGIDIDIDKVGSCAPADQRPRTKRRAPGNPGRRAAAVEIKDRIYEVAHLLVRGLNKRDIRRHLRDKYELGSRQAETYMARARTYLRDQAKEQREDLVALAYALYSEVIRNPESSIRDRMDAMDRIRQLFALDAPKRAPVDNDGKTVAANIAPQLNLQNLSLEELAVLRKLHLLSQGRALPAPQNPSDPLIGFSTIASQNSPKTATSFTPPADCTNSDLVIDAESVASP